MKPTLRFKAMSAVLIVIIVIALGYFVIHKSQAASADINSDGSVNVTDLSILASNYGRTGATFAQGDINGDGSVNVFDLSILATQWSSSGATSNSCPSTTPVAIATTDNAQSIVDAHPAGTTYMISTGVHNGFSVSPHSGDTYCAETGAVLDGNNTTAYAFDAGFDAGLGAHNVSIIGAGGQSLLEIRNYKSGTNNDDLQAAIHDNSPGNTNWLIRYIDIHSIFPVAINLNTGTQVRDSKIHDNTTLGISASSYTSGANSVTVTGVVIDHNEMYNNDATEAVSCDNEAGALKVSLSYGMTFSNNYIHDNGCDGLWMDGGYLINNPSASNNVFTNNIIVHNGDTTDGKGSGIHYEISGSPCTITGNYVSNNNYSGDPTTFSAGQIFISNSYGCEIANNTIIGPKGVVLGDYDRPDCSALCPINNENIHDNNFYFNGSGLLGGGSCVTDTCAAMTNGSNHWQNNHYHLPNVGASVLSWPNASINQSQWQAFGFDTTGTFDSNTSPPTQPAWSL